MDKVNLQKRILEMDEDIKLLAASSSAPREVHLISYLTIF